MNCSQLRKEYKNFVHVTFFDGRIPLKEKIYRSKLVIWKIKIIFAWDDNHQVYVMQ